jgi:Asp-tRNA(Asn)/Glu-tRNA(Gln) amidotransferase A subunit family amidase
MPTRGGEPTAAELVALLARREASSRELVERHLERIGRVNPALNAAVHVASEQALAAAGEADRALAAGERRPLLGLPLSIKDSIAVAGMPCLSGSHAREGNVPKQDATVVARLREAGAIVLCKTNVPEYTWSTETENAVSGRTNNPYDLERTCGGSSGGEAALHAVDASPAGIGSDGLCSIRVPAHFCGTFGLRPTVGLVPETGAWPTTRDTGMLDMSTLGPMGRSVEDLALLMPVIAGPDGVDPFVSAAPLGDHRAVEPAGLRVGFSVEDGVSSITPGTRAAVEQAARALAEAGAHVEEASPPPLEEVLEISFGMMAADGGARARADLAAAGGRHVPQLGRLLETLAPGALSAEGFFQLMRRWIALRSGLRRFVSAFDAVLCPVAAGPAPCHGRRPSDDGELTDYGEFTHSFAYAVAGVPVAVAPVGRERGLPVGVQVVAPPYRDHVALGVAGLLEHALSPQVPLPELRELAVGASP